MTLVPTKLEAIPLVVHPFTVVLLTVEPSLAVAAADVVEPVVVQLQPVVAARAAAVAAAAVAVVRSSVASVVAA